MTRNILSGRISGSGLVSFGDNQIVQMENDIADVLGIPKDVILANPIWGIDEDGNITRWTNLDDPGNPEYGVPTIKDIATYAGFRIWDETNSKEILFRVTGNELVISEADTPGQDLSTGTWHTKLSIPLAGAAGQNIDLDLNGQASKYLICKADESGIDWADSQALAVPSCQIVRDTDTGTSDSTPAEVTFESADWELNGSDQWEAAHPKGIQVPTTGVYQVQAYVSWANPSGSSFNSSIVVRASVARDPLSWASNVFLDNRMLAGDRINFHSASGAVDLSANNFIGLQVEQASGGALDYLEASLALTLISTPA